MNRRGQLVTQVKTITMIIKFQFSCSEEEELHEGYVDYLKEKNLREATKFINDISPFKRVKKQVYHQQIVEYTSEVVVFDKGKFEQAVKMLRSMRDIHGHQVNDALRIIGF